MKLTDKNVAALKMPDGKNDHFEFCDTQPGFGVRLRGSGEKVSRTLCYQYRVNGRTQRVSIGDARQIKVEVARDIARIAFGKIAKGEDPAADRAAAKADAVKQLRTFGKTVDQYLAARANEKDPQLKLRASSLDAATRYLRKHFEPLHSMPIDTIKRADVASRIEDLKTEHGITSAARARTNLSSFFAWAIGMGLCEHNPVTGTLIPGGEYKPRERILSDDELRIIWTNLHDDTFGKVVKLLMYTGCRRGEIGDLQWSEIDTETGLMTLPPERVKNDEALILPLPPSAMAIIKDIPRNPHRENYVFGKKGKRGFNAWSWCTLALNARIVVNTGKELDSWTLHDLRRTFRTGLGNIGIAPHIAELCIGHLPPKIQRAYDKGKYLPEINSALLRWADHLDGIIEGRPSNVIDIKQHA